MSLYDDHESQVTYVLMGVVCSLLAGGACGLFVGLGAEDLLTGVYAFVGITILFLHLYFWKVGE